MQPNSLFKDCQASTFEFQLGCNQKLQNAIYHCDENLQFKRQIPVREKKKTKTEVKQKQIKQAIAIKPSKTKLPLKTTMKKKVKNCIKTKQNFKESPKEKRKKSKERDKINLMQRRK